MLSALDKLWYSLNCTQSKACYDELQAQGWGDSEMLLSAITRQGTGALEYKALSTSWDIFDKKGNDSSTGSKISCFTGLAGFSL